MDGRSAVYTGIGRRRRLLATTAPPFTFRRAHAARPMVYSWDGVQVLFNRKNARSHFVCNVLPADARRPRKTEVCRSYLMRRHVRATEEYPPCICYRINAGPTGDDPYANDVQIPADVYIHERGGASGRCGAGTVAESERNTLHYNTRGGAANERIEEKIPPPHTHSHERYTWFRRFACESDFLFNGQPPVVSYGRKIKMSINTRRARHGEFQFIDYIRQNTRELRRTRVRTINIFKFRSTVSTKGLRGVTRNGVIYLTTDPPLARIPSAIRRARRIYRKPFDESRGVEMKFPRIVSRKRPVFREKTVLHAGNGARVSSNKFATNNVRIERVSTTR